MTTGSVFAAAFNRYRLGDSADLQPTYGLTDQISLLTFGAIMTALMVSLFAYNLGDRSSPAEIKLIDRRLGATAMLVFWGTLIITFAVALA